MKWMGKRYSNPLSWLIWLLLEVPTMLIAVVFDKTGKLLRWIGALIVRHVYYVFVRLARWADRKPGWREQDSWIGVPPPADAQVEREEFDPSAYFEESKKRGRAVLESIAMVSAVEGLSAEERCDLMNAVAAMGTATATVSAPMAVPFSEKV